MKYSTLYSLRLAGAATGIGIVFPSWAVQATTKEMMRINQDTDLIVLDGANIVGLLAIIIVQGKDYLQSIIVEKEVSPLYSTKSLLATRIVKD